MNHERLVPYAVSAVAGCGVVMLLVASWAGERSEQVGGVEATSYGWGAVFLLLAGVPVLLLAGAAALLHRRPLVAGNLCSLAGVAVLLGGGAGLGTLAAPLGWLAAVVGVAVVALGVAASQWGTASPR